MGHYKAAYGYSTRTSHVPSNLVVHKHYSVFLASYVLMYDTILARILIPVRVMLYVQVRYEQQVVYRVRYSVLYDIRHRDIIPDHLVPQLFSPLGPCGASIPIWTLSSPKCWCLD